MIQAYKHEKKQSKKSAILERKGQARDLNLCAEIGETRNVKILNFKAKSHILSHLKHESTFAK